MKKTVYSINLYCLLLLLMIFFSNSLFSQIIISGNVYDSTKLYAIPGVEVFSTSGASGVTDSTGAYQVHAKETDSIYFFYNGKSTLHFPVKTMKNYSDFDISLHVRVKEKYKMLNPVLVFTNSYQMDSLQNREDYAKIFGQDRPHIASTYEPGGPAGLDLDALIGMFQFRKNKQRLAFKNRLEQDEMDRYVDYRFSAKTVARVTGLKGEYLERYRRTYRPDYFFVANSTLAEFYEYILQTSYSFKRINRIP